MKKIIIAVAFVILSSGLLLLINKTSKKSKDIFTIGVVSLSKVDDATFNGFRDKMKEYGYEEHKNIEYIKSEPAERIEKLDGIVKELLKKDVDMFFVSSTPGTLAVKKAVEKRNIPVVFCPVNDPVASGIITSLKHPDGGITGIKLPSGDRQRVQWLFKIFPKVKNILVPFTPGDKSSEFSRHQIKEAALSFGVNVLEYPLISKENLEKMFIQYKDKADSMVIPRDSSIESYIDSIIAYGYKVKMPISAPSYQQVEKGALFTYGFIHYNMGQQAAKLASSIIHGVKPSLLPVEIAESYLVINRNTADKIGLKISDDILVDADKIIDTQK